MTDKWEDIMTKMEEASAKRNEIKEKKRRRGLTCLWILKKIKMEIKEKKFIVLYVANDLDSYVQRLFTYA